MLRLGELCWRDFRLLAGRRAGAEEVAGHDREEGGGGSLSAVKPFSLDDTYSVASRSHIII